MTEEKLSTIEEWFEENKNENDCAGLSLTFKGQIKGTLDEAVNEELNKEFLGKITHKGEIGFTFINVMVHLDLVLSKEDNGKITYFIDDSQLELV